MTDPADVTDAAPPPPPAEARPAMFVALIRDLMFAGRVRAEAAAAGVPVRMVRDPAKLAAEGGARLIVDLNLDGALDAAAAWRAAAAGRDVVAFVAHTDADAIRRARAAGIDQVMPRSRFVEVLPQLLRDPLPPHRPA